MWRQLFCARSYTDIGWAAGDPRSWTAVMWESGYCIGAACVRSHAGQMRWWVNTCDLVKCSSTQELLSTLGPAQRLSLVKPRKLFTGRFRLKTHLFDLAYKSRQWPYDMTCGNKYPVSQHEHAILFASPRSPY